MSDRVTQAKPTTHHLTRWLFLRLLAGVCFIAFVSYGVQIEGLIGSNGLLPVGDYLQRVENYLDAAQASRDVSGQPPSRLQFPTLTWLAHDDTALEVMVWGGAALSLLCLSGVTQGPLLIVLWMLYLSLVVAGQTFLGFQWDSLLLETLVVSWFVAPFGWRPRSVWRGSEAWPFGIFLLRFLLFKLMFLSGVVKLLSMDDAWWQLSALDVHYMTQPIPTWTSWYAHQLPGWFQKLSVVMMFFVELVVPFFVFGPRRLRLLAFVALVGLQLAIAATGNYGFFNLLTMVLCVPLLDDRVLERLPGLARRGVEPQAASAPGRRIILFRSLRTTTAAILLASSALTLLREMSRTLPATSRANLAGRILDSGDAALLSWAQPLLLDHTDPFRSINGYGLFRAMTLERPEIVIAGSLDGESWREYEFKWKPGDPARRPPLIGPHMPRLDWQMWFAALDPRGASPWLLNLARALLEGNQTVIDLLAANPFPEAPPRYLRLELYDYRFTSPQEKRRDGNWWARQPLAELTQRPLTLDELP